MPGRSRGDESVLRSGTPGQGFLTLLLNRFLHRDFGRCDSSEAPQLEVSRGGPYKVISRIPWIVQWPISTQNSVQVKSPRTDLTRVAREVLLLTLLSTLLTTHLMTAFQPRSGQPCGIDLPDSIVSIGRGRGGGQFSAGVVRKRSEPGIR
jgi:hypothetical protein